MYAHTSYHYDQHLKKIELADFEIYEVTITKCVSLSMRTSLHIKIIISCKCNTHPKSKF
jgi:hypothetical protein